MYSTKTMMKFASVALGLVSAAPAFASTFDIDFSAARVAGSSCRLGENAFLNDKGRNSLGLELGDFRVGIGTLDGDAGTSRSTCVLGLPGKLPRGYTVGSVKHRGAYSVLKSVSSDVRLSANVLGSGIRSEADELAFPKGRSAFAQLKSFQLTNEILDDGSLCNPSRSEDVTLTIVYAASAVKGSPNSYAELETAQGREIGIDFEIVRCR
jgi:hypothetical protein